MSEVAEMCADEITSRVRELSSGYGPAEYASWAREAVVRHELWRTLGEEGFLGVHIPREFGGGGQGIEAFGAVLEAAALEGVPLPTGLFSCGVIATILAKSGSREQQEMLLPRLVSGKDVACFAMTEPEAGLNTFNQRTSAIREGDDWVITGHKTWITGFADAPWMLVMCRTGQRDGGRPELSLFVVPTDSPGVSTAPISSHLELPERSSEVHFDAVRVGRQSLVGVAGSGLRAAFPGMNAERLLVGRIALGIGSYALRHAADRVRTRQVWGTPLGAHQAIAHPLARARIALASASLTAREAARMYDSDRDPGFWSNVAKLTCVDAGISALDVAVQAYGGAAFARDSHLLDHYALLRAYQVGPVSTEMVLNFVAEHELALPKSY